MKETVITVANQTQVPAALRLKYGVSPGDVVVWEEEEGRVVVRFRRRYGLDDLVGAIRDSVGGDALADKRRIQRGGR